MARSLTSLLNAIKRDLALSEYRSARDYLGNANAAELIAFREQKLLFKIQDHQSQIDLANLYKLAAVRTLGQSDNGIFEQNYAEFSIAAKRLLGYAKAQTSAAIRNLPQISTSQYLSLFNVILKSAFEELSAISWNEVGPQLKTDKLSFAESASLCSRTFHEVVGATNDILFASCRALNEAVNNNNDPHKQNASKHLTEDALRESLSHLIALCSTQNSIEYTVNMVTYGEWVVTSITGNALVDVHFDLMDPLLDYARTLAIRRDNMRLRARLASPESIPEVTANILSQYLAPFIARSLKYLTDIGNLGTYSPNQEDISRLYKSLRGGLSYLCRDDDLLFPATDDPKLFSHYLAAVSLRWFTEICEFTSERCSKPRPDLFEAAVIDPDVLGYLIGGQNGLADDIRLAIPHYCRTLPVPRYLDICNYPFFVDSDSRILSGGALDAGNWPLAVRSKWLQGGQIGDRYGKIWEFYVSRAFEWRDWLVVGRGIRLKAGGATLTDVDLLVIRESLLLAIQVKALIGYGTDTYDQWKSRNTISLGARQANIAACFLRNNRKWMTGLFGDALARRITDVQPLVVTNVSIFDGWIVDEVPVVSVSGLNHILSGAKLTFTRGDGQVVSDEKMIEEDLMTSESFMDLIRNPWNWRLAKESMKVAHIPLEFGGMSCRIPSSLGGWAIKHHAFGFDDENDTAAAPGETPT